MKSCLGGWDVQIFARFLALGSQALRTFHLSPRLPLEKRLCRVVHRYASCISQGLLFASCFLQ